MLSATQIAFFHTFGYLHVRDYFSEDIGWITEEFEAAWSEVQNAGHDGSRRTIFPGTFIAATPRLTTLLENPRVAAACTALLGHGYGFHATDGNLYAGDTPWHSDAFANWPEKTTARHLKIAWYLDPLTRSSGALRVIPGSHLEGDRYCAELDRLLPSWSPDHVREWAGADIPAVAVESRPGDLVCFDHRTKHASFGGTGRRRMFTTNWIQGSHTPAMHRAILDIFRYARDAAKVDWNADRGPWFSQAPPAREPVLRQLKEFGALAMADLGQVGPDPRWRPITPAPAAQG